MNRVILCGWLVEPPRRADTVCGIPVVRLRLQVPRPRRHGQGETVIDELDVFAFRDVVGPLTVWDATGRPVSLEAHLLPGPHWDEAGEVLPGAHVWVDRLSVLDARPGGVFPGRLSSAEQPAPKPVEAFLRRTAREVELPESLLPDALATLAGDSLYDVINTLTRVAQRLPVAERVRIETAMSRFLREGRNRD